MILGWICNSCELEMGFGMEYSRPVNEDKCPVCGGNCEIGMISAKAPVFSLDPISGDHLIATRKWEKHREQKMKKEQKNLKEHGTYD